MFDNVDGFHKQDPEHRSETGHKDSWARRDPRRGEGQVYDAVCSCFS